LLIDELYRARYDETVEALTRIMKNRADAEEATAEAFTVIARMGTPPRDAEALLWTVAQRRAFDTLRRRDREMLVSPSNLLDIEASEHGYGRWDGIADIPETEARVALTQAMSALDDIDRDAWALTELRGLTTYEAAEVLGVYQPTASRRAERARLTLKENLA
jgi:RNA polymerase sigma factor (sigma-70 family)